MLSNEQTKMWERTIESLRDIDPPCDMQPVGLTVDNNIGSLDELIEEITLQKTEKKLSEEDAELAMGFCNNLKSCERPDAEIVDMVTRGVAEDRFRTFIQLIFPGKPE